MEKLKQLKQLRNRRMRWELATTWFPLLLSIPLALLIIFDTGGFARILLGLPFVLFFPGYILILALFPARGDLDGIERVALSFGLSIAVAPLLGLLLNYTPWGIRLYPILLTLTCFVMVMTAVAVFRRSRLSYQDRFFVKLNINVPDWSAMSRMDRILSLALASAIVFAIGSVAYVAATPKTGEKFTEFYILGPGGKAEGYPRDLKAGEEYEVIFGAVNHEYRPVTYAVEVRSNGYLKNSAGPFELNQEEKMEAPIGFTFYQPGENIKAEILLFKDGESEPYRSLHLWVNVQ